MGDGELDGKNAIATMKKLRKIENKLYGQSSVCTEQGYFNGAGLSGGTVYKLFRA